ncbi:hypothetical protein HC928_03625 [bacterium]|nr:hypothetical protein [bacterium]
MAAKAQRTAAVISDAPHGGEHVEEYRLRDCFIRELEAYHRKPCHGYSYQPFNARGLSLWRRVAKAWRASGTAPDTFIKAQFTFFHNTFGRPPKPQDLTTDGAVVRAASVPVTTVRTRDIPAETSICELFRHCEKHMADVMRAQKLTREDVYRRLVKPGFVAFPEKFLAADPVWKKVKNDG